MTPSDRRAKLLGKARDPMWQMIGVLVTVLIAVVTALAGLDDDHSPAAPVTGTSVTPVPPALHADVDGSCNAVGNGNSVSC